MTKFLASEIAEQRRAAVAALQPAYLTARQKAGWLSSLMDDVNADDLAEIRQMIGVIDGFFPTPTPTAESMVHQCRIVDSARITICEPSAGAGHIADQIRICLPSAKLTLIETSSTLCNILRNKGYNPIQEDFLAHKVKYDYFIMNPPFENDGDIKHVTHAFSLLKKGGRIVSIMGGGAFYRNSGIADNFRQWLKDHGESWKLPDNTFRPSGTNVSTRLVIINK